jgi:hypothetical protein
MIPCVETTPLAQRLGEGADAESEVRQFFELDDFPPSQALDRFRQMEKALASRKHG